jgi:ankyrin repeat protein
VIRLLVKHGANVKATSHGPGVPKDITEGASIYKRVAPRVDVFTPLQFAVQAGHLEATRPLVELGGDLKNETPQGMSLLTLAIANAHYDVAAFLVDKGADINESKIGWTPLHQVVRMRTLNIGQFPHPVPTGSMTSYELAKYLLARGADVDARTKKGWQDGWRGGFGTNATPFLLAAKGADHEMMRLLVANGANPRVTNVTGATALMLAAGVDLWNPGEDSGTKDETVKSVTFALELGIDVNAANQNGETALHGAAFKGVNPVVEMLVERGARLDTKSKQGRTPLMIADGIFITAFLKQQPHTAALLRKLMTERGLRTDEKCETCFHGIAQ